MRGSAARPLGQPRWRGRPAATLITLGLVGAFALTGCSAGQVAETALKVPAIPGIDANVGDIAIRNAVVAFPSEGYNWPSGSNVPLALVLVNNGATADRLVSATSDLSSSITLQVVPEGGQATSTPEASPSTLPSETPSGTPSGEATGATPSTGSAGSPPAQSESPGATPTISGAPSPAPSAGTASPVDSPLPTASPGGSLPLELPAQRIVGLEAGGPQIVLTSITEEINPAAVVKITLTFERAGDITIEVPFAPPATPLPRTSITHAEGEGEHGTEGESGDEGDAHTE